MRKFTLGLNTGKITNYNKKFFKLRLFRIKFPTKKSVGAYASNGEVFINHRLVQEYNAPGGVSKCQLSIKSLLSIIVLISKK